MAMMALFAIPLLGQATPSEIKNKRQQLIDSYIEEAAAREYMEPALLRAVVRVESNFNHKARSRVGASGLMQLMPATANSFGNEEALNFEKPRYNILAGARYLRFLINRYEGNLSLALAAYNAGETAVDKYSGIPPYRETQQYVKKVLFALKEERKRLQ